MWGFDWHWQADLPTMWRCDKSALICAALQSGFQALGLHHQPWAGPWMVCSEKGPGRVQQKRNPCKVTRRLLILVSSFAGVGTAPFDNCPWKPWQPNLFHDIWMARSRWPRTRLWFPSWRWVSRHGLPYVDDSDLGLGVLGTGSESKGWEETMAELRLRAELRAIRAIFKSRPNLYFFVSPRPESRSLRPTASRPWLIDSVFRKSTWKCSVEIRYSRTYRFANCQ